jgi:hypothetical protein
MGQFSVIFNTYITDLKKVIVSLLMRHPSMAPPVSLAGTPATRCNPDFISGFHILNVTLHIRDKSVNHRFIISIKSVRMCCVFAAETLTIKMAPLSRRQVQP